MITKLIGKIDRQEIIQVKMNSKLANRYLNEYANLEAQRPIKLHRIKNHLQNIKDGFWISSQIVIGHYYENEDHRTTPRKSILDGHHRLHAIVKADTQDGFDVEILKIYASKETIRQIYGFFDSKKSARDLKDLLKWKTAYHDDLKNRWELDHLVTLTKSLPYASGHYFYKFPFNCLPKGMSMQKDDFLSDCLDNNRWWFALDELNSFLNDLKDRTANWSEVRNALGNVVFGVFLNSFESLSNRGRRGETYNKTKDFWNAVVDGYLNPHNTPKLIKQLHKVIEAIKIDVGGKSKKSDETVAPIFYVYSQAVKSWKTGNENLGISKTPAKRKIADDVIKDFFMKGEGFKDVHPIFKLNRYWEEKLGGILHINM